MLPSLWAHTPQSSTRGKAGPSLIDPRGLAGGDGGTPDDPMLARELPDRERSKGTKGGDGSRSRLTSAACAQGQKVTAASEGGLLIS